MAKSGRVPGLGARGGAASFVGGSPQGDWSGTTREALLPVASIATPLRGADIVNRGWLGLRTTKRGVNRTRTLPPDRIAILTPG